MLFASGFWRSFGRQGSQEAGNWTVGRSRRPGKICLLMFGACVTFYWRRVTFRTRDKSQIFEKGCRVLAPLTSIKWDVVDSNASCIPRSSFWLKPIQLRSTLKQKGQAHLKSLRTSSIIMFKLRYECNENVVLAAVQQSGYALSRF